jgi:drug/metabolite transporter (DMT)-like permease
VLVATLYALTAACLHASWNLMAKRSEDVFLALWGQFLVAGAVSAVALAVIGDLPAGAWRFAAASGMFHVPYLLALAWAYRHGDFSLAYPLARGGGALVAAIGGLVVLGDRLSWLSMVAIVVVVTGMALLASGAPRAQVGAALVVAATIGGYTLFDSHAAREYGRGSYVFATYVAAGTSSTIAGLALGRGRELLRLPAAAWRRTTGAALMTITAYGLVLLAVQRAPVGYVAALRESSVLIAVVVGARLLGEGRTQVRAAAASVVLVGLALLVAAR